MEYTHYYVPPLRTEIFEDAGFGFMVGMAWGCGFNFIKGTCNKSNRGNRLMGGLQSVHINHYGASSGGRFAAYTVLAECFLRGMNSLRQGRWNWEISGAVAGGIVQMGRGVTGISKGVILGSSFAAFVNQLWVIEKNFPENVGVIDRNTLNKKNYTVWSKPDAY